eukprot:Hpha_TRINITY_DN15581_c1_g2::TRINITY_DN15581_c1_g2_i1::g.104220::m.104220
MDCSKTNLLGHRVLDRRSDLFHGRGETNTEVEGESFADEDTGEFAAHRSARRLDPRDSAVNQPDVKQLRKCLDHEVDQRCGAVHDSLGSGHTRRRRLVRQPVDTVLCLQGQDPGVHRVGNPQSGVEGIADTPQEGLRDLESPSGHTVGDPQSTDLHRNPSVVRNLPGTHPRLVPRARNPLLASVQAVDLTLEAIDLVLRVAEPTLGGTELGLCIPDPLCGRRTDRRDLPVVGVDPGLLAAVPSVHLSLRIVETLEGPLLKVVRELLDLLREVLDQLLLDLEPGVELTSLAALDVRLHLELGLDQTTKERHTSVNVKQFLVDEQTKRELLLQDLHRPADLQLRVHSAAHRKLSVRRCASLSVDLNNVPQVQGPQVGVQGETSGGLDGQLAATRELLEEVKPLDLGVDTGRVKLTVELAREDGRVDRERKTLDQEPRHRVLAARLDAGEIREDVIQREVVDGDGEEVVRRVQLVDNDRHGTSLSSNVDTTTQHDTRRARGAQGLRARVLDAKPDFRPCHLNRLESEGTNPVRGHASAEVNIHGRKDNLTLEHEHLLVHKDLQIDTHSDVDTTGHLRPSLDEETAASHSELWLDDVPTPVDAGLEAEGAGTKTEGNLQDEPVHASPLLDSLERSDVVVHVEVRGDRKTVGDRGLAEGVRGLEGGHNDLRRAELHPLGCAARAGRQHVGELERVTDREPESETPLARRTVLDDDQLADDVTDAAELDSGIQLDHHRLRGHEDTEVQQRLGEQVKEVVRDRR